VQTAITGDFIVLPCDLVCELDGLSLLEEWMIQEAGLGGASGGLHDGHLSRSTIGGEKSGRRGGLGVWYPTKGEDGVKGEETDFIATTPLPAPIVPSPRASLRRDLSKLVYAIPTDTVKDITEGGKTFPIRHSLLKKHGRIKMHTTYRDAHIYFFPFWVLEMMKRNASFESVGEDVVGWWAKAGWQDGLGDKLDLRDVLVPTESDLPDNDGYLAEEEVDVASFTTTHPSHSSGDTSKGTTPVALASRVQTTPSPTSPNTLPPSSAKLQIPPILAYVQPLSAASPIIRRVDSAALLLTTSLRLAKLPSLHDAASKIPASPFAHALKVAHPDSIPVQCRVEADNSLLAENVTVSERCQIKESVVGTGCTIGVGAKLFKCLLMEGAVVGDFVSLTGCILGRRCMVEGGSKLDKEKTDLRDCEVQDSYVVPWGSESKLFSLFTPYFLFVSGPANQSVTQRTKKITSSWYLKA
jgi:translation initiation factor eIF-2B subunit gamma